MPLTQRRQLPTWSPSLAYAIGLLATDGNLSIDGRHIILTSSDRLQLVTFKECLGLQGPITLNTPGSFSRNPNYRVQFSHKLLYGWLEKVGLTPHKTGTLGPLKIPTPLFADFLRGVIDGDGSIVLYTDRWNVYKRKRYEYLRLYVVVASASFSFLDWIQETLQRCLDVHGGLAQQPQRPWSTMPHWKLRFAKNDSLKILRWIYYDNRVPCLQRKRVLAEYAFEVFRSFRDKRVKRDYADKVGFEGGAVV